MAAGFDFNAVQDETAVILEQRGERRAKSRAFWNVPGGSVASTLRPTGETKHSAGTESKSPAAGGRKCRTSERAAMAYALSSWHPTPGTRATGRVSAQRRDGRRLAYTGGRLQSAGAMLYYQVRGVCRATEGL